MFTRDRLTIFGFGVFGIASAVALLLVFLGIAAVAILLGYSF